MLIKYEININIFVHLKITLRIILLIIFNTLLLTSKHLICSFDIFFLKNFLIIINN